MSKIAVWVVVFLFLLAGVLAVLALTSSKSPFTGEVVVHIEEIGTGNLMQAVVSIGDPKWDEGMLLSFGQSIRTAAFTPDFSQDVPSISKTANYKVWGVATVSFVGTADSLSNDFVQFTGYGGWGYEFSSDCKLQTSAGYNTVTISDCLQLGSSVTVSQTSTNLPYTQVYTIIDEDARGNPIYGTSPLVGNWLDHAVIQVTAHADAVIAGSPLEKVKVATLQIHVTSWATGQMVLSVIGMGDRLSTQQVLAPLAGQVLMTSGSRMEVIG